MKNYSNRPVIVIAMIAAVLSLMSIVGYLFFEGEAWRLSALTVLTLLNIFLAIWIPNISKRFIREISKASGLASGNVQAHVDAITKREQEAIEFINSLRNDQPPSSFIYLDKSSGIGSNLLALTDKLHAYKIDESKRSWTQGGLAKFSELQKEGKTLEEFAARIISFLVKSLEANQGALFVEVKDQFNQKRYLELKGCYAYDKKKFVDKRIAEGEGLLGECMLSHDTIFMTDVPGDYIHITSGLGHALPRNIIITPLLFNKEFFGAVEIATFHKLEDYQVKFLEKVCEYIAAEIGTRKSVQDTEKLLSESQELTHKLKEHEEEMRQHMEELTATQEQMKRKQSELDSVFSAINNTVASLEFDLNGNVINGNSIFLGIAGYSPERLKHLNYYRLLPAGDRAKPQHEMMWKNLQEGKFFSGEFKMMSEAGEELWMTGTFNPILDGRNVPYKVIMIAQFTTQEKAKLSELNGTIAAAKNSVPFLEIDTEFRCKTANERFLKMFGIKRMELKDKPFSTLIAKNSNQFKKNFMAFEDQKYFEDTLDFTVGDQVVTFVTGFTPIRDHNNKTSRIVVILSDKIQSVKIAAVA